MVSFLLIVCIIYTNGWSKVHSFLSDVCIGEFLGNITNIVSDRIFSAFRSICICWHLHRNYLKSWNWWLIKRRN